jgi:hypothetical protein
MAQLGAAAVTGTERTLTAETIAQLMRFYNVETMEQLVLAQDRHIERLQAKLPPTPDTQPRKSRFA